MRIDEFQLVYHTVERNQQHHRREHLCNQDESSHELFTAKFEPAYPISGQTSEEYGNHHGKEHNYDTIPEKTPERVVLPQSAERPEGRILGYPCRWCVHRFQRSLQSCHHHPQDRYQYQYRKEYQNEVRHSGDDHLSFHPGIFVVTHDQASFGTRIR